MTITMAHQGEKIGVETPTYIASPRFTGSSDTNVKKGIQKKHVLIVIGMIILAGLIIAGILVGMYIFAEAQKEIVKFSLNFKSTADGQDVKQDVESDPNDNSVTYHISKDGKDVQIVDDFNRDIQVVRMETTYGINCYISALNRSDAMDPSQITGPEKSSDSANAGSIMFTMSTSPISDRSFLPKKALEMCKSVSVYWAYRSCISQYQDNSVSNDRQRRAASQCKIGCGLKVCSCHVDGYQYVLKGKTYCHFYAWC